MRAILTLVPSLESPLGRWLEQGRIQSISNPHPSKMHDLETPYRPPPLSIFDMASGSSIQL